MGRYNFIHNFSDVPTRIIGIFICNHIESKYLYRQWLLYYCYRKLRTFGTYCIILYVGIMLSLSKVPIFKYSTYDIQIVIGIMHHPSDITISGVCRK